MNPFSLYKKDERCVFLYVHLNSDDFQMFFPSEKMRIRFHQLIMEIIGDQIGISDLDSLVEKEQIEVSIFSSLLI